MEDEETPKLSWDHQTILLEGKPFYPDFGEQGNTLLVKLSCEPHFDLDWKIPTTSKRIVWEFQLGLESPFFPLGDELRFESLSAALKHFTQTVWPKYKEQSLGGILFRGSAEFQTHFLWTDQQKENERLWIEEKGCSDRELFCADAFAAYFQLLAHRLPDDLPLVLCFDARSIENRSRALRLLSKERFEHFLLALRSENWPMPGLRWEGEAFSFVPNGASLGICIPPAAALTDDCLVRLEKIMERLDAKGILFRAIPEAFLSDQWEGLDEICVLPEALSVQGKRKLRGFSAAGGQVIEEENRGRGI